MSSTPLWELSRYMFYVSPEIGPALSMHNANFQLSLIIYQYFGPIIVSHRVSSWLKSHFKVFFAYLTKSLKYFQRLLNRWKSHSQSFIGVAGMGLGILTCSHSHGHLYRLIDLVCHMAV